MTKCKYSIVLDVVEEGTSRVSYSASHAAASDLAKTLRSFADAIETGQSPGAEPGTAPGPADLMKTTLAAKGRRR